MSGKRISPLDRVNNEEFIRIVKDLKPKIGLCGGRYFESGKKSYSMNQITAKFCKAFENGEGVDLGRVIFEKDAQATAMLKKANCFQKMMTKIKQKEGNRQFKKEHTQFIGKEAVLQSFARVIVDGLNQPLLQPRRESEPTPLQKVKKAMEDGALDEALSNIVNVPESERMDCYLDLFEAYRKRGDFKDFDAGCEKFKDSMPTDANRIYLRLAVNSAGDGDEDLRQKFLTKANWIPMIKLEPTPLQKVEQLIKDGALKSAWPEIEKLPKEKQKDSYYKLLDAYRKQGYFDTPFNHTERFSFPQEYQKEIYQKLAHNTCYEAKRDEDYRIAAEFAIRAGGQPSDSDAIFLDVADKLMAEKSLEQAFKALSFLADNWSSRAQELYDKLGKAYIAQDQLENGLKCIQKLFQRQDLRVEGYKLLAQKYALREDWLNAATCSYWVENFNAAREYFILEAKRLENLGQHQEALNSIYDNIAANSDLIDEDDADLIGKYLNNNGTDFNFVLAAAIRKELKDR